jgi:hypothetical protein
VRQRITPPGGIDMRQQVGPRREPSTLPTSGRRSRIWQSRLATSSARDPRLAKETDDLRSADRPRSARYRRAESRRPGTRYHSVSALMPVMLSSGWCRARQRSNGGASLGDRSTGFFRGREQCSTASIEPRRDCSPVANCRWVLGCGAVGIDMGRPCDPPLLGVLVFAGSDAARSVSAL